MKKMITTLDGNSLEVALLRQERALFAAMKVVAACDADGSIDKLIELSMRVMEVNQEAWALIREKHPETKGIENMTFDFLSNTVFGMEGSAQ